MIPSSTRHTSVSIGAFLLLFLLWSQSIAQDSSDGLRTAVKQAFARNEQLIKSARFIWDEDRVITKGAASAEPPIPAEDLKWRFTKRFTIADLKMDYYATVHYRNGQKPTDEQHLNEWKLFDGHRMKEYVPPLDEYPKPHPHGSDRLDANAVVSETTAYPFVYLCRMSMARERFLLEGQTTSGRDVNGNPIIIFRRDRGPISESFWVSPDRSYSITKYVGTQNDKPVIEFDISYDLDAVNGVWIPDNWRYTFLRSEGQVFIAGSGKLKEYTLNPTVDATEFVRTFPVGTQVVTDDGRYIVRPNNGKRIIGKHEYNIEYDVLLNTEPTTRASGRAWTFYAVVGGLIAAAILLGIRIRRRGTQRGTTGPG